MGGKDYFVWREMVKRCQQGNDRHMQSLLRQMKQLKQENEDLRE